MCEVLLGDGLGLATHEGGHLVANWLLESEPYLRRVQGGRIPFFAVTHFDSLPARHEFIVSSAGIWAQFVAAEWILTSSPHLRRERAPIKKGILAFHVATSTLYGIASFGEMGPPERDTRGIALGWGRREEWVGISVVAPGILDAYRYFHPTAKWARCASRLSKGMLLVPLLR